jgi:hypothetical protein
MEKLLLKATLGESDPKDAQLTNVHVSHLSFHLS